MKSALTHFLPYISLSGARNNGAIAKETKKIDSVRAIVVSLLMSKVSAMNGSAGAITELLRGVTSV
jgi:hypothetical protein